MKKRYLFATMMLLLVSCIASADVPPMINYQGKLLQPSGAPVPDGTYQMTFSIYGVPTGGTALWTETNTNVQVKGGLFAAMLGSVVSIPSSVFDNPSVFFGVKVGSDPEMTPRQQIVSSAFAFRSGITGAVDPGAIVTSSIADGAVTASKIASGAVTTGAIADGAVGASQISTSAILLGYASTTSTFQVNGDYNPVQIPGLSVTVNVPAGGRGVKITVCASELSNSGGYAMIDLWDGPVGTGTELNEVSVLLSGSQCSPASFTYVAFPPPGARTYSVGLRGGGNPATLAASNSGLQAASILVEAL